MMTAIDEAERMVGPERPDEVVPEQAPVPTVADNNRAMAELEAMMKGVQR